MFLILQIFANCANFLCFIDVYEIKFPWNEILKLSFLTREELTTSVYLLNWFMEYRKKMKISFLFILLINLL